MVASLQALLAEPETQVMLFLIHDAALWALSMVNLARGQLGIKDKSRLMVAWPTC